MARASERASECKRQDRAQEGNGPSGLARDLLAASSREREREKPRVRFFSEKKSRVSVSTAEQDVARLVAINRNRQCFLQRPACSRDRLGDDDDDGAEEETALKKRIGEPSREERAIGLPACRSFVSSSLVGFVTTNVERSEPSFHFLFN